jgi:hypothetical protein
VFCLGHVLGYDRGRMPCHTGILGCERGRQTSVSSWGVVDRRQSWVLALVGVGVGGHWRCMHATALGHVALLQLCVECCWCLVAAQVAVGKAYGMLIKCLDKGWAV